MRRLFILMVACILLTSFYANVVAEEVEITYPRVNLRKTPYSERIGILPEGEVVTVLDEQWAAGKHWYHVYSESAGEGYIDSQYTEPRVEIEETEEPEATEQNTVKRKKKSTPVIWYVTLNTEQGSEQVELVTLGIVNSVIKKNDEKVTVPTIQLRFGNEQIDHAQYVVSVQTATTGYVSIRTAPYEGTTIIGKIPDGRIAGVVEPGETFTKVVFQGITGYVVNKGIVFHDVSQVPVGEGTLYQKDKKETSIWMLPENDSKWIKKWPQGESVTILAEEGDYYAIENDGFYGWLKKKYVKHE